MCVQRSQLSVRVNSVTFPHSFTCKSVSWRYLPTALTDKIRIPILSQGRGAFKSICEVFPRKGALMHHK